jgi:hypothetical protein
MVSKNFWWLSYPSLVAESPFVVAKICKNHNFWRQPGLDLLVRWSKTIEHGSYTFNMIVNDGLTTWKIKYTSSANPRVAA